MKDVDRRRFLKNSLLTAATLSLPLGLPRRACAQVPARAQALVSPPPFQPDELIDTNVYLSGWPFRQMRGASTADRVAHLRRQGVTQAWAGSFDGLFHKDTAAVNRRLAEACRPHDLLVPFGTVNPMLPDWEEELRRCCEEHQMPGIRVHPNYQNYALDDPTFAQLLKQASEYGLMVQLVPWMQDERHHHPKVPVPTVDLAPLSGLVGDLPDLRLVLLNGFRATGVLEDTGLLEAGNVFFDFAKLDVLLGLARLLDAVPLDRVVFGSFSPLFYFEAAPLKMRESALSDAQIQAICHENARRVLARP